MKTACFAALAAAYLGMFVLQPGTVGADAKTKDDGTFLKYRLAVEARGTIKIVDKRLVFVTRQRIITERPGSDFGIVDREESFVEVTRELVFGNKDLRERAEKLEGKTVLVRGCSAMVLVHWDEPARIARPSYERWEIEAKIHVSELEAAK
jgi:hypothetical protein